MPEIFTKLGLDVKLIVAQAVNFILLLVILHRLAYKPILRMLEKRSDIIDKSLKQAQKIEEELQKTEKDRLKEMKKAREKYNALVAKAEETGKQKKEEMAKEAKRKTEEIIARAKEEIRNEKEKSIREARQEIADLAIKISKKIIGRNIDEEKERELIKNTLAEMKINEESKY